MNHENHNHCEHKELAYCKECSKPYCKNCKKEWENSCNKSHYQWFNATSGTINYPKDNIIQYCVSHMNK